MSAALYVIATPIGNLADITYRAVDTLDNVVLIAAEDTRHSKQLLSHLGIATPMLSLHEHNERERCARIINRLEEGESVALISDAGTPLISDPGFVLVKAVWEAGFTVIPVPGASSVITALCAAGLPTDRFNYHGFLPHKDGERIERLKGMAGDKGTQVLLESTHRIMRLLQQIDQEMPEAMVVVAKELTKRHEAFFRGSALAIQQQLLHDPALQKGEFVVLIDNPEPQRDASMVNNDQLLKILLAEVPVKQAVKIAVQITGERRNDLYQRALELETSE